MIDEKNSDALSIGQQVPASELTPALFGADEGAVQLIYGRIRNGKSTEAVRRMYECLTRGFVVYSNIRLDLSACIFDDRLSVTIAGRNLLLNEKRFYRFRKENFRYFNPTTGEMICNGVVTQVFDPKVRGAEIAWLNSLTDCYVFYDEGQWLLDSYEATNASVAKRKFITETGHVNRTIVIIAQRTQSVHVNARGNVNQFFRCQKIYKWFFFQAFQVEEFQDMSGNDVDENAPPVSVKTYFVNRKYWSLFNTHYLRAGRPRSQEVYYEAYDLDSRDRFDLLGVLLYERWIAGLFAPFNRGKKAGALAPELSLGDKVEVATQKNEERLNTVLVGGSEPVPPKPRKRVDFAKLRKDREAEKEQNTLPF